MYHPTGHIVKLGIVMTLSCVLDTLGIFDGLSTACIIGLIVGDFFLHLNPAIPCPNLGFSCETSFLVSTKYFSKLFVL